MHMDAHDDWHADHDTVSRHAEIAHCCCTAGKVLLGTVQLTACMALEDDAQSHAEKPAGCAERALNRRLLANRFGDSSITMSMSMSMSQSGSFDTSTHTPEAGTLALACMQQEV